MTGNRLNQLAQLTAAAVLLSLIANGEAKSFDGYTLIRLVPKNDEQLHYLQYLAKNLDFENAPVDFWRLSKRINESSDLMLSPTIRHNLFGQIAAVGLDHRIIIDNVGSRIEEQRLTSLRGRANADADFFDNYHPIEEIYAHLEYMRSLNPEESEIEIIGKSYEGRDLKVLKIGNSNSKKVIWIDGGTHAREWIGPATALFMAHQVSTAKKNCREGGDCDADMSRILETYDFYFQPSVNPDGYQFSQSDDRLWRKTRSEASVSPWNLFCKGTDPNRNYDAKWGGAGSSGNPCSQTYAGPQPHSEPEIKSLTGKVFGIRNRVAMFISLHSYSQIMLLPYGHSSDIPAEYDDLDKVAQVGAAAIKSKNGTEYRIGSSARILYAASGTASDWAFETAGIKYSYTFELPDTGDEGFLLPPERIKPVGDETWAGVKAMIVNLP